MSSPEPPLHRSYLYAPGSAPEVMRKALTAGADAVILDLEDAVPPQKKAEARAEVATLLDEIASAARGPSIHVRINRDGNGYCESDLDAVVHPALDAIRLPKAESPEALTMVASKLDELERIRDLRRGYIQMYPTVESALGVVRITGIATSGARIARLAIGTADLLADLGASGDDDLATLHIRSELVLRSRAANIGPPIDSVYADLNDQVGLRFSAQRARSLGFHGKAVIHPRQLEIVHQVFTPTEPEIARAQRVIDALEAAVHKGIGTVVLDGEFVDAAMVARAHAVLSRRNSQ